MRTARLVTLITILAAPGAAQTPEAARLDSLQARLDDAEARLEMLQQQMAAEAESALRTRSRFALELSGRVLMNVFSNSNETNNADVPMYNRLVASGTPRGGLGMGVRQTALGAAVSVQDVLGGTFTGDLDVDFFGGQVPSPGGRTFPLLRIRTARGVIAWERAELLIGQEQPLVAGLNPVSLASVGAPNFSYAGNLWLWLPQVRYGVHSTGRIRLGAQVAALAPTSAEPAAFFATGFDAAERSKQPFLQARAHVGWGADERRAEIGVGVHQGRLKDRDDVSRTSSAVTLDFLVPLGGGLELRGEAFSGQALAGLGGGGIGQNFAADSVTPLEAVGGWAQLNYQVSPRVLIGAAFGVDETDDGAPLMRRNATTEAHLHWRPSGPLVFGLEWRSTRTRYAAGEFPNTHLNLAFGFEF